MASDTFLKIEGITGESQDALHEGEIDITAWSWCVEQDARHLSGAGGGQAKAGIPDAACNRSWRGDGGGGV